MVEDDLGGLVVGYVTKLGQRLDDGKAGVPYSIVEVNIEGETLFASCLPAFEWHFIPCFNNDAFASWHA